jgi:hypothetical protein
MADFVGGPDVKMDGVFGKDENDSDPLESPRSPLYTTSPQTGQRPSFSSYQNSDDSEDPVNQLVPRGRELQNLKGRLSMLSLDESYDEDDESTSTTSAPVLDDLPFGHIRPLHSVKTMPQTKDEKKEVLGDLPPLPIVRNAAPRPSPPAIPWPINKVLSPIRTKIDPSSPKASRSPSPAELPPEPTTPRAWERSEASQVFTPPAHSHLPGEAEIEELLRHAPLPGKSPLRVSS